MNILIDNLDLTSHYGITILDYTDVFSFPAERENERKWYNKSGVDRNLVNARYDEKEFYIECCVKSTNEAVAYNLINTLVEYMLLKKVFVLSLRDTEKSIRECFLCERSKVINPNINIRPQNSLFVFKLGLTDVNPNALKFKTTIALLSASISYTKGRTASIFWGNGDNGLVSNSGTYTKDDYSANGLVDIIIDIDKDASTVVSLVAEFSADQTSLIKVDSVQFTDASTGNITVWSWAIYKGAVLKYTSAEQDPLIEFDDNGDFTVVLQVFNESAGSSTETKIDYITVRNSRMLVNAGGDFALVNAGGDFGDIN